MAPKKLSMKRTKRSQEEKEAIRTARARLELWGRGFQDELLAGRHNINERLTESQLGWVKGNDDNDQTMRSILSPVNLGLSVESAPGVMEELAAWQLFMRFKEGEEPHPEKPLPIGTLKVVQRMYPDVFDGLSMLNILGNNPEEAPARTAAGFIPIEWMSPTPKPNLTILTHHGGVIMDGIVGRQPTCGDDGHRILWRTGLVVDRLLSGKYLVLWAPDAGWDYLDLDAVLWGRYHYDLYRTSDLYWDDESTCVALYGLDADDGEGPDQMVCFSEDGSIAALNQAACNRGETVWSDLAREHGDDLFQALWSKPEDTSARPQSPRHDPMDESFEFRAQYSPSAPIPSYEEDPDADAIGVLAMEKYEEGIALGGPASQSGTAARK